MGVRLVLPNLASLAQRGDLGERWSMARRYGLDLVEVPADLIKNRREAELTGLPIGSMPEDGSVELLYDRGDRNARYMMHTDPGIYRRDARTMARLRWGDEGWTDDYVRFLSSASRRLGPPPEVVEVHSGRDVDIAGMVDAMARLRDGLRRELRAPVIVALENKPGQAVATVKDIIEAMDLMDGQDGLGIMLDVPNLWKAGRRQAGGVETLPTERLVGMHVHERHRAPPGGAVDWSAVRRLMCRRDELIVNPEVFHRGELERALYFIRQELLAQKPHKGAAVL